MATLWYSCWDNLVDRGGWWATVHGVAKSDTIEATEHSTHSTVYMCQRYFVSSSCPLLPSICSDVDEPRVCNAERSKSEREKIHHILMHIYIYIIESRKMVLMNLFAEKEERHRYREWTSGFKSYLMTFTNGLP